VKRQSQQELAFVSGRGFRQCLHATGADVDLTHLTVDHHTPLLDIGVPASFDVSLRKAHMIAELRAFSANFTFCHQIILQIAIIVAI
jgi:ribonuclease BN (tRNA processing enzyme)